MAPATVLTLAWIFGGCTGWGLCRLFWLRERHNRRRVLRV